MTPENANRRIIKFLRDLADDGSVQITQNRHPLVSATHGGQKRTFGLACSPSSNYQRTIRCRLNRFVRLLPIDQKPPFHFGGNK